MWIERISLENFLAFAETSVELGPGLNVVLSPNEGGKSSLFRGILTGLYVNATSQRSDVKSLARWGSGDRFRVELDLRLGERSYRLVRDFGAGEQALFRDGERNPFVKGKGVDSFLAEHLPLSDRSLFLRVCGVRHEELALVGDGKATIGERIEEILGGGWGDVTPARVQQVVDDKRKELLRGRDHPANEANRGAVKRFMDDVERLEGDAAKAAALAGERERLLRTISGLDSSLRIIDDRLDILKAKREKASAHRELETKERAMREKADGVRRRMGRIEKLLELRDALIAEGNRLPASLTSGAAPSLDEVKNDLLREGLIEREITEAGPGTMGRAPAWRPVLAVALLFAGIVGAILWSPIMLVSLGAGLVLVIWHLAARRGAASPARKGEELEQLRKKRSAWSLGRSLDDSKALLAECASWRDRMREVGTRLEESAGGGDSNAQALLDGLDDEYGALALDMRALQESLTALEPFRLESDEMLQLDREIGDGTQERERLAADRADRDRELAALERMDASDVAERLASARENLKRVERRVRVMDEILDTLGESRRQVSGMLAERLPPLAGGYLSRITGGRYGTLFIDPMTMRIEVAPAAGDAEPLAGAPAAPARIETGTLSQGARDQIHLAVRLALVEFMSRGEPQPLFLDDPFVHFDPVRRDRTLDLVREFACRHQVVVFTCDPHYRDAGGRLTELSIGD
jgi:uncharacterized protein YhaN